MNEKSQSDPNDSRRDSILEQIIKDSKDMFPKNSLSSMKMNERVVNLIEDITEDSRNRRDTPERRVARRFLAAELYALILYEDDDPSRKGKSYALISNIDICCSRSQSIRIAHEEAAKKRFAIDGSDPEMAMDTIQRKRDIRDPRKQKDFLPMENEEITQEDRDKVLYRPDPTKQNQITSSMEEALERNLYLWGGKVDPKTLDYLEPISYPYRKRISFLFLKDLMKAAQSLRRSDCKLSIDYYITHCYDYWSNGQDRKNRFRQNLELAMYDNFPFIAPGAISNRAIYEVMTHNKASCFICHKESSFRRASSLISIEFGEHKDKANFFVCPECRGLGLLLEKTTLKEDDPISALYKIAEHTGHHHEMRTYAPVVFFARFRSTHRETLQALYRAIGLQLLSEEEENILTKELWTRHIDKRLEADGIDMNDFLINQDQEESRRWLHDRTLYRPKLYKKHPLAPLGFKKEYKKITATEAMNILQMNRNAFYLEIQKGNIRVEGKGQKRMFYKEGEPINPPSFAGP